MEPAGEKQSSLAELGAKKALTLLKKPVHAIMRHQKREENDTEEDTVSGSAEETPVSGTTSVIERPTLPELKIKAKELLKESLKRAEEPNHFNYYYSQRTAGIGGLKAYFGKVIAECQECIDALQLTLQSDPSDEEASALIQQLINEQSHLTKAQTLYQAYVEGDFDHPIHEEFFSHPREYQYLERWIDSRIFDRLFPLSSQFSSIAEKDRARVYNQKLGTFYKKNENRFDYLEGWILLRLDSYRSDEAIKVEEEVQPVETSPIPEPIPIKNHSILSRILSLFSAFKTLLAPIFCFIRPQIVED